MKTARMALLLALAGCGSVDDAPDAGAPGIDASDVDAAPGGPERCNGVDDDGDGEIDEGWAFRFFDAFEGDALDPLWDPDAVNEPPIFSVANGAFTMDDSAKAPTPSQPNPDISWIYDVDQDLGNQMARAVPVMEGAFELDAEMFWDSQAGDFGMAGVGLTGQTRNLDLFFGLYDPTVQPSATGTKARWIVRKPGPTEDRTEDFFPGFEKQRVRVHASRKDGIVMVTATSLVDDNQPEGEVVSETFSEAMPQGLVSLVVVSVRSGNDALPFGTFGLRHVAFCSNQAP